MRPPVHHPVVELDPLLASLTDDGGHNFKADQRIVLEQLDKWKGQQGKIIGLTKDGGPVSKSRQHPVRLQIKGY